MPLWGRVADRRGNMFVMRVVAPGLSVLPLMWLVTSQLWFLVAVNVVANASWAGFGVASLNFVMENSDEKSRASAIGYFRAMSAIGSFLGSLAGGAIASHLPTLFNYQIMTLFLISGVQRLSASFILLPMVKGESRQKVRPRFGGISRLRLQGFK